MFLPQKKKDKGENHRINSGGTMRENGNGRQSRHKKFRDSIMSSKANTGEGNLFEAVILPIDEEEKKFMDTLSPPERAHHQRSLENEWVAENIIDFQNDLHILFTLCELDNPAWKEALANPETLQNNGYPPNVQYLWKVSADKPAQQIQLEYYVKFVMDWIEKMTSNTEIFPTDEEQEFKVDFIPKYAKKIMQRMFRIFAIIFVNPILNRFELPDNETTAKELKNLFLRFMFFCWHWNLVPENETRCIKGILASMKRQYSKSQQKYLESLEEEE